MAKSESDIGSIILRPAREERVREAIKAVQAMFPGAVVVRVENPDAQEKEDDGLLRFLGETQ